MCLCVFIKEKEPFVKFEEVRSNLYGFFSLPFSISFFHGLTAQMETLQHYIIPKIKEQYLLDRHCVQQELTYLL